MGFGNRNDSHTFSIISCALIQKTTKHSLSLFLSFFFLGLPPKALALMLIIYRVHRRMRQRLGRAAVYAKLQQNLLEKSQQELEVMEQAWNIAPGDVTLIRPIGEGLCVCIYIYINVCVFGGGC